MTPAINLLKKYKAEYQVLQFEHDPNNTNFALEAATHLNVSPSLVFKTLLVDVDGQLHVAVLPATKQVELKQFAKAVGGKRAAMAEPKLAERITGYLVGGISPLAQKRRLKTLLHSSAMQLPCIYVSAGKRGLEVAIAPEVLLALCGAEYAEF
ncbi:Cys-tRNA(Pro) deacylase [Pseudoalteromonas fenneropenaei]|uniref:Cys-tRNA(Pro)/Cys-tRNA(Cys) deacylase n=1 Tax=Pseudoalteromonas fenneropenaei TaxID=1737459 RepID=A0ABV7CMP9_9GAMM